MKAFFKRVIVAILTAEAKILLRRHKPVIIAVTGSVGKTSTKDAIYSILKKHVAARKSEKSFNSEIGVPLTVLGLPNAWNNPFLWFKNIIDGLFLALFSKEYPSYLVLETGVDRPGDMKQLTTWVKPDIVVLTRFPDVPVHVEFFSSPEAVTAEKMLLVEALKPNGVVIYNHDDAIIQSQLPLIRQQAIGYSRFLPTHFTAGADAIFYKDDVPAGMSFTVKHLHEEQEVRVTGAVGLPFIYTYTGAIAVAMQCGISFSDAASALADHVPPPGRMRVLPGLKGTVIIDDTYNSSPTAAEQALATLKELQYGKRKIVVLGDMLELGRFSAREHERIGELVPTSAQALFTVGIRAQKIAEGALIAGMDEQFIFQHESADKAGRELQAFILPGDIILVKASQGIRAEKIVEEIMAEPLEAPRLLVRQDTAWQER